MEDLRRRVNSIGILLGSQGHHRIDLHRPSGGRISRDQSDEEEEEGHHDEVASVNDLDPIENASQQVNQPGSDSHSSNQAGNDRSRDFAKDESKDIVSLGADGHADADLASPEGYNVADRAEDTDQCEYQAEHPDT